MAAMSASFQSKISKIETSLLDLNKEITTAGSFLQRLKLHSTKIVQELNNVSSPAVYLKDFVQVNSFLLKYLSFLTEINCKFEMMQILDNDFKPEETNKTEVSDVDYVGFKLCKPLEKELKNGKNCEDLSVPIGLQSSTSQKSREKNLKEAQKLLCQLENPNLTKQSLKSDVTDDNIPVIIENQQSQQLFLDEQSKISVVYHRSTYIQNPLSSSNKENPTIKEIERDIQTKHFMEKTNLSNSIDSVHSCGSDELSINPSAYSTPSKKKNCNVVDKTLVKNDSTESEIRPANTSAKLGDEFEVIVEHIKSPSEFYVHIINSKLNLLMELEKRLKLIPVNTKTKNNNNHKRETTKVSASNQIGAFALYYSKCEEAWYRAKVTDWCLAYEDEFVYIFLLDYGESKCVSIETLQPMPEVFKIYPAFAQRCHLHGVFPMDMKENSESLTWGKESSEKMRYLIEKCSKLKIVIVSGDRFHPPTSLPVTLWLVDKGNECVNKLLVNSKYAVERIDDGDESLIDDWNPMKEDFESYQNSYDLNLNDPAAVIYGYVGKDYDRLCRHFVKTGRCYKGDSCKKEHAPLDPSGFTSDKEEVYRKAFNDMRAPSPNEILHVQVTCISSVNEFCCFPCDQSRNGDEENLSTLLNSMNSMKNVRELQKLLVPPSTGQIVVAQYTEDDSWYRAKVVDSQPENDVYAVVFVDYGNRESLPLSRIRAIDGKYLHLPFQAIQCFIFGVKQNPLVSPEQALNYLNKRIGESQISIEVVSKLPGDDVVLFVHVFDQNGENIGEDLIAKGYAIYKQDIVISDDCEVLPG